MTLNEYQAEALRTMRPFEDVQLRLFYLGFGLAGETGEVVQRLKRMISGGGATPSSPDSGALVLELGDVLWYIAAIAYELGITLEDVAVANQRKLGLRAQLEAC